MVGCLVQGVWGDVGVELGCLIVLCDYFVLQYPRS